MFLSDTKENREVVIKDLRKNILKPILEWMYGVDIFANESQSHRRDVDLCKAAHRYRLESLKDVLNDRILTNMTAETAFDVYVLGDIYRKPEFKAKALDIMKR
jgi:hypothetical protein